MFLMLFLIFQIILWSQIEKFLFHSPSASYKENQEDLFQKDDFLYKEYKSSNNPSVLVVYLHGSFSNIDKHDRLSNAFSHIILEYPSEKGMNVCMNYCHKFFNRLVYDRKPEKLIVIGQDTSCYIVTKCAELNPWIHKTVLISPYLDLKSLIADNTHWIIGTLIPQIYVVKKADLIFSSENDELVSKDKLSKIEGIHVSMPTKSRDISIKEVVVHANFLEIITGKKLVST